MNTFKSTVLLVTLTLFLILIGEYFGGRNGMVLAFLLSVAFNFGTYFFSDKIALKMYNAQPVTREQLPRAYAAVERLTAKQGLPMPKMYVLPTESPNAFATGRNPQHASVAVTQGILQLLDDEELEGVLAHELGHVKNRDILTSSIAASLIQLAISRSREFEADKTGAATTGDPYALARALQKLDAYSKRIPMQASPSNAHLFIVAPLLGSGGIASLFSTHPPMKERIQRLIGRDHV